MSHNCSSGVDVLLAIDPGGEGTKIIYGLRGQEPAISFMEPETIQISHPSYSDFQLSKVSVAEPEDACVIGWDGTYYAVGYLAKTQFLGNPRLRESKTNAAIIKSLGALWVVSQRLKLPERFKAAIATVLPPGEFADRAIFERELKRRSGEFSTPAGKMRAKLDYFQCLPEATGCYLLYLANDEAALKNRVVAFVMIGYRNASILVSRRGVLKEGSTSDLGFQQLVKKVVASCSNQDAARLAGAIATATWGVEPEALKKAAKGWDNHTRSLEIEQIAAAIKKAQPEYWSALTSWLTNTLPPETDEIVFCGGTADYLRPPLEKEFAGTPLVWHSKNLNLPQGFTQCGLGSRIYDVWGLYQYLSKVYTERGQQETASAGGMSNV